MLLPIMEIVFVYEKVEYNFNALNDSSSERSYLADSLRDVLNCWGKNCLPENLL